MSNNDDWFQFVTINLEWISPSIGKRSSYQKYASGGRSGVLLIDEENNMEALLY